MTVLRIELNVPVECRFTKQDTFNGLPTYPIPPCTTIRGMCYAALNRPSLLNQNQKPYLPDKSTIDKEREFRSDFEESTHISVQTDSEINKQTDLRSCMKVGRSDDKKNYKTYVANEESIINPKFIVYMKFDDESLQDSVKDALQDPERLLYMGKSDDLVSVKVTEHNTENAECDEAIYAPLDDSDSEGEDPTLIPTSSDYKGTYTSRPAQSTLVSIQKDIQAKKIEYDGEVEYFKFFD